MTSLVWDEPDKRIFETGIDRGVLYPASGPCVPWNGLTGITQSPSGGESTPLYADNLKYVTIFSMEDFKGTIEAFTYPPEFSLCDGTLSPAHGTTLGQQTHRMFGLSYRTRIGNALLGTEYAYKLHVVYGAVASPTEKAFGSISDSPEAIKFSWEFTTTPVPVTGFKPVSHIELDTRYLADWMVEGIEGILYGDKDGDGRLPTPDELIEIAGMLGAFMIFDNHDGTLRAVSFDNTIRNIHSRSYGIRTFDIVWDDVVDELDGSYLITTP
jgi:hypothetical protein